MNLRDTRDLKFLILFSFVFTASAFLFSFLSWGRIALGPTEVPWRVSSLLIELGEHAGFGAIVALPTRKLVTILEGTICAVTIDVDHFGSVIGLPTVGRSSHAILFAVLIFVVMFLLAR